MTSTQQIHRSNGRQQQCHERLAKESQNRLDPCQCRNDFCHRVCDDEHQRDHNDANDGAELGQLAFVDVLLLCNVLRNRDHVLFAAERTPDGAGDDHRKNTAEDADEDDPAKVNTQHGSDQNRAGRGRNEGMADGQTCQQRDNIVQNGALRALCQRESQRDEDDQARIKEDGHCNDQTRDAQCPRGFFIAEFAYHGHCQCLRTAGFLQNRTEHGTKTNQKGNAF